MIPKRRSKKNGQASSFGFEHLNTIISTVLAAAAMHGPGLLQTNFAFEEILDNSKTIFGAVAEGTFLLLLMFRAFLGANALFQVMKTLGSPTVQWCYLVVISLLFAFPASFIVASILGDAAFRAMSGGEGPDAEIIVAGLANAREHVISQFSNDPVSAGCRLAFAVICFLSSICVFMYPRMKLYQQNVLRPPNMKILYASGMMSLLFCAEGFYSPVIHAYFSATFGFKFTNEDNDPPTFNRSNEEILSTFESTGPNVIFLQHDSLSGSLMLNTGQGQETMPFFQSLMRNDDNMYVFEHARSVSGDTIDGLMALMTGCLPFTEEGKDRAYMPGRSIGNEFRRNGYHTASFSSVAIDSTIKVGKWSMLGNLLVGGMDKVFDPVSESLKRDNGEGCDDRKMIPLFARWLLGLETATATRKPFYAQFYNFNNHFPYVKDNPSSKEHRYFASLRTTDDFLKDLFQYLNETGKLEETIIVGSGDHGDDPFKQEYVRMQALNSNVLHTTSYIYYPKNLIPGKSIRERLRRNTQQLVDILDFFPTLQHIIYSSYGLNSEKARIDSNAVNITEDKGVCVTGVDLTAVDIPDNRVTIAWNRESSKHYRYPSHLWALSTKEKAIYHRSNRKPMRKLRQGRSNFYVMTFKNCTRDITNHCMTELDQDGKSYFRPVLKSLDQSLFFGDELKKSELVNLFTNEINA